MKIIVNGKAPEDIREPDPQRSLEDFLGELRDQFSSINRVINDVRVDDQPLPEVSERIACGEINELSVRVSKFETMAVQVIGDLGEYCQRFLRVLPDLVEEWEEVEASEREKYRRQVTEALTASRDVFSSLQQLLDLDEEHRSRCSTLRERAQALSQRLEEEATPGISSLLREQGQDFFSETLDCLQDLIDYLQRQQSDMEEDVQEVRENIRTDVERIPKVVDQLQKGKEKQGLEGIEPIAQNLRSLLQLLQRLDAAGKVKNALSPEQQEKLQEIHQHLETGLDEITGALEDRDIVMICDVLDYEIQPYLETVDGYLEDLPMTPQPTS